MRLMVVLGVVAGVLAVLSWYWYFHRYNRRRGRLILRWIEQVFDCHGRTAEMIWERPAQFRVRIELTTSIFRHAAVVVQLLPRQQPLAWLLKRIRRQTETLTFQADLDSAPSFNLEVHNFRWYGRSRSRLSREPQGWTLQQNSPFVLTTRNEWQREITSMMNALVASRECDCSCVSFRRFSPHFSATVPLETIAPDSQTHTDVFDVLRELAAGASTARF